MQHVLHASAIAVLLAVGTPVTVLAGQPLPGASVESLLVLAKERNPEFASMRYEADAAFDRIAPAGALPDPKLRVELMDITMAGEQSPTLQPNRVGGTKYTVMQDLPWFGKRDLKRDIAALEADAANGLKAVRWLQDKPHVNYLISLVAGYFKKIEES